MSEEQNTPHSIPCLKKFMLIASAPQITKPQEITLSIEFTPENTAVEALESVMAALGRLVEAYSQKEVRCYEESRGRIQIPSVLSKQCEFHLVTKEPL